MTRESSALHDAPIGLYRAAPDGRILSGNREFARILGLAWAELAGARLDTLHAEPGAWPAVHAALAATPGAALEREVALRRRDGRTVWVRDVARATSEDGGAITHIDGVMEDVTARRASQEERQADDDRFRQLVHEANDVLYVFDAKGTLLSVNDAVEPLFGYKAKDLVGRNVFDLIDPADMDVARKHHMAKLEGREDRSVYEVRLLGRDGAPVWTEISSHAIRRDGTLVAIHGVLRDMRKRKAAQDELLRTQDLLQDLIRNANDVLYTHDLSGRFLSANAMACRAFGYPEQEFLQLNIKDLVDPAWLAVAQENLRRKVEGVTDRSPPYEVLCRARGGSPVWLEISSRLIRQDGRPAMVSGIGRDITHRKWAEARLKESETRFRTLFERMPVGLFRSLPDGTVQEANPALLAILRYPDLESFRARRLGEVYVRAEDRIHLLEQLEADGMASYEIPMRRFDGTVAWVRGTSRAVRGPDGQVQHFEGHVEDITAEHEAGEGLRLVQEMAVELNHAGDFASALGVTVRRICQATGWAYGEAWVPSDDGQLLTSSEAWYSALDGAKKFRHLSARLEFRPGEGVPGQVWSTRKPMWRADLALEPHFERASAARAAGFRTLLAVPVESAGQLVATLLFLHREARPEDVHWVHAVESIASQLGAVMARRHAEDVLRRQTRVLQSYLAASDDGVLIVSDKGEVVAANQRLLDMCGAKTLDGGAPRWGARELLQGLADPDQFQDRVRFLYEDPGEGRDELVVLGRRYIRDVALVRDADDLPWGRIWTFREASPARRLVAAKPKRAS